MTRVWLTYFMQAGSIALGISAVGFGAAAYSRGQILLVVFNVILLAANVSLFFVLRYIRKLLMCIKRMEEITLRGVNGER